MIALLLARILIKDYQQVDNPRVQGAYTVLTNVFFMVMMGAMGVVKFLIGNAVGSLAITSSSFADFADIGLGLMMMLSYRLANKKPDAKHPFGYARIEYITGMVVSLVILLLGVNLFQSSLDKILNPVSPEATLPAYIIMLVSVVINFTVFSVNRKIGGLINNIAIKAAATKNIVDGLASLVVVIMLGIFSLFAVDLDGYVGLLMSGLIIFSALTSLKDTVNPLLGLVPDLSFSEKLTQRILSYPNILSIHNLVIHNYGNNRCYVSLHADMPGTLLVEDMHQIICDVEQDFSFEGIHLTIHPDIVSEEDEDTAKMKALLYEVGASLPASISISDLRVQAADDVTYVFFTVTAPRDIGLDAAALRETFNTRLSRHNASYKAAIKVNYSHI